jgi:serine/threonine protein kinase
VLVEKSSGKVAKSLQIKLIDFGISVDFTKTGHVFDKEDMHGTLLYMSPESLSGNVTFGWDVWSCGVACYMLATRKPPYCYKNEDELMDRISNADIVRKSNPFLNADLQQLSKELKLFIMNLLTKS